MKIFESETLSPNPLKIFKNVYCFNKILNGFKTTDKNKDSLVEIIMYQPKLIHSSMTRGYTLEEANFLKLSCKVYYNIPLISFAWFGKEKGYSLKKSSNSNVLIPNLEREELSNFLDNIDLPDKITPINLEMTQTIKNVESTYMVKIK